LALSKIPQEVNNIYLIFCRI